MKAKLKGKSRQQVFDLLTKPMSGEELARKLDISMSAVHNAVFHLKKLGMAKAERVDGITMYSRLGGRSSPAPRGSKKKVRKVSAGGAATPGKKRRGRKPNKPAAAHANRDVVEGILQRHVERTQAALDEYVATLGDPEILGGLKAARDRARQTLAQYLGRQPE